MMLGLDGAGKTTILYRLTASSAETIPTVGFNVESVGCGSLSLLVWDFGGRDGLRPLWRQYLHNAIAVIFVVDSGDRLRRAEARRELEGILSYEGLPRATPILVYANKQDLQGAMPSAEVADALGLSSDLVARRRWHVQAASGTSGQGLQEGLEWLHRCLA